jgi:hypothetical protein
MHAFGSHQESQSSAALGQQLAHLQAQLDKSTAQLKVMPCIEHCIARACLDDSHNTDARVQKLRSFTLELRRRGRRMSCNWTALSMWVDGVSSEHVYMKPKA